jgi:hypothetical protein
MKSLILLSGVLILTSCGLEGSGTPTGNGGVSSEENKIKFVKFDPAPCLATFTEDYTVMRDWGRDNKVVSISKGEQFIISEFGSTFNKDAAISLLYPLDKGVYEFEALKDSTKLTLPFETNCEEDQVQKNVGVFADIIVFANEDLSGTPCELKSGFSKVLEGRTGFGYSRSEGSYDIYSFSYNFLEEACPDFEDHYMKVWGVEISSGNNIQAFPIEKYLSALN